MAQSFNVDLDRDLARGEQASSLGREKLGVIAGFLVGLPLGVGFVDDAVASVGPQWLATLATVIVVAGFTWGGLRLASQSRR